MAAVPHLRIPFRIGPDGTADVLEQDSATEIAQCVGVLAGTRPGTRSEVPTYGLADPTFLTSPVAAIESLRVQVEKWEPRATIATTSAVDAYDPLTRRYRVSVQPASDVVPSAVEPLLGAAITPRAGATWDSLGSLAWDDMGVSWDTL